MTPQHQRKETSLIVTIDRPESYGDHYIAGLIEGRLDGSAQVSVVSVEPVHQVGIDYCLAHSGTRNEDDRRDACDWAIRDGDSTPCNFVPLYFPGVPGDSGVEIPEDDDHGDPALGQ